MRAGDALNMFRIVMAAAGVLAAALLAPPASAAESIDVDGRTRTYELHVPASAAPGAALVIAFHGFGGDGRAQQVLTRMNQTADEHGFVVAYPNGLGRQWHFGGSDIDDIAFTEALIDQLVSSHGVDPSRVYVTGMSNGGFFSIHFACARPDRVAAVATVGATLGGLQRAACSLAPPHRVLMIAGTEDPLVPFEGNAGWLSVPEAIVFWAMHNGLSLEPTTDTWLPDVAPNDGTQTRHIAYGEGQVQLLAVAGGGHTWPGGIQYLSPSRIGPTSRDFNASEAIWSFFTQS
jgi:polyhydroxybutyrate depolymerase